MKWENRRLLSTRSFYIYLIYPFHSKAATSQTQTGLGSIQHFTAGSSLWREEFAQHFTPGVVGVPVFRCYVVCGEQTTAWRSAARIWPLTAGPYVPVSPSVLLSPTLALILSLSDSPGSTLRHCHSLAVSLQAGRGLSSTERRVTPGEQRQPRLQVNGNSGSVSSALQECWKYARLPLN